MRTKKTFSPFRAGSPRLPRALALLLVFCLALASAGCDDGGVSRAKRQREVAVFKLVPQNVSLTAELSGRVSAFRRAEVRPQVSGILQQQLFTEGSMVEAGQSLYKIDPDTYIAAVESARAAVASAEATLHASKLRRDRRQALLRSQAVSQQAYEDANAEYLQAKANLEVARASLRTAEIQLRYTDVLAPITGRIGKSTVTQGALVTANQAEELAVIQQLDPVYVDMTQSSLAMLELRDRYAAGRLIRPGEERTKVHLRLETGNSYPLAGELKFADITVDESTGSVLLRSVFPNPHNVLLPGMYVKAYINEGVEEKALLVPQRAVRRDPKGNASVFVLTKNNTAEQRPVVASDIVDRFWLVSDGLKEGEMVIIEGLQGLRQDDPVKVREILTPETYSESLGRGSRRIQPADEGADASKAAPGAASPATAARERENADTQASAQASDPDRSGASAATTSAAAQGRSGAAAAGATARERGNDASPTVGDNDADRGAAPAGGRA